MTHKEFLAKFSTDPTGHAYLLDYFLDYDYRQPIEPHRLDIRRPDNIVGYWQRACMIWWAIEGRGKTGDIGLELGSAGVRTPWCLGTDVRTGLRSHYPMEKPVGEREVVKGHTRVDCNFVGFVGHRQDEGCADTALVLGLDAFQPESFGAILTSHVLEHTPDNPIETLTRWRTLLKPGGVIACVIPDQDYGDVMQMDPDHKHAWRGREFGRDIARQIPGLKVLEHTAETQPNYHSFLTVWQRI